MRIRGHVTLTLNNFQAKTAKDIWQFYSLDLVF